MMILIERFLIIMTQFAKSYAKSICMEAVMKEESI